MRVIVRRKAIPAGTRFGRIVVIGVAEPRNGKSWSKCKCDCGREIEIKNNNLKDGHTKSCGCMRIDVARTIGEDSCKHGLTNTRLYRIWSGMKQRCCNCKTLSFKNYGGRGLTVCDEWQSDFTAFREWAMAHGYADNLSIDRIDNDGNYEPTNCRWVDMKTQEMNKRNTIYVELDGIRKPLVDWCEDIRFPPERAYQRYFRGKRGSELFKPIREYTRKGK